MVLAIECVLPTPKFETLVQFLVWFAYVLTNPLLYTLVGACSYHTLRGDVLCGSLCMMCGFRSIVLGKSPNFLGERSLLPDCRGRQRSRLLLAYAFSVACEKLRDPSG